MNYCPNCGTKVESFWNVCANCGYHISERSIPTLIQKEQEKQFTQVRTATPKPVKTLASKPPEGYFEPERTYGTVALVAGIVGLGLTFLIIFLRIIGTFTLPLLTFNNVMIIILAILAIITGIIGIIKDNPKVMGIIGLILGVTGLIVLFIRAVFFIVNLFIPLPL
ncbi:MAG: zinc ribbon domain-containing protein [Promethearchaeota archaeon]